MALLRVVLGLIAAALFLAVAAPLAHLSRRLGWRRGPAASVALHRWFCAVLRLRLRRFGTPGPAQRLIVANHVSWLDIVALGAMERSAFLAKKEVGLSLWTRWIVELQGVVYVDRERKGCIPAVNAEMSRRIAAGDPVVLFAEATTSDGVRLLTFRSSHFEAACAAGGVVQPVFLHFKRLGGLAIGRRDMPQIAWYGDMAFLPHLFALLASGGVECDVHYGAPIRVADHGDRKALARATETAMRRLAEGARKP